MLISRRKFLGMAGAGAAVATCTPNALLGNTLQTLPHKKGTTFALESMQQIPAQREMLLGYPLNMEIPPADFFVWRKKLFGVGVNHFGFNNIGNPYTHSHIPYNTHHFEKELINRFSAVYGFSADNHWGFLTNSGTDSNMHGIYMGRTLLEGRTGVTPKIYFTREAHYSIQILRDLLNLEWVVVATNPDGSMDINDLDQKLRANSNQPALVVATIGTTFKGAIDSIDGIQSKLKGRTSYLHLDAALFGGYLPHTQFADELLHKTSRLNTDTASQRYDSIAVSCHKFFGYPSPAGLFITTQRNFENFHVLFEQVHDPEYVLQVPGTITCSRDSVKPAEFHFFSSASAFARQAGQAKEMLNNADYLLKEMKNHFAHLKPVRANNRSNTIYFKKPDDKLVNRYILAAMELTFDGEKEAYAHIVVMPHVSREILDRFLSDLDARKK